MEVAVRLGYSITRNLEFYLGNQYLWNKDMKAQRSLANYGDCVPKKYRDW